MMFIRFGFIVLLLGAYVVPAAMAEPSLTRELNKMGSDICRSLKLNCKKADKAPRKAPPKKTVAKPAARKAVAVAVEPKSVPIPRPKPQRVEAIAVPKQKPAIMKPAPEPAILVPPAKLPVSDGSCVARLKSQGAEFEQVAAPPGQANCVVDMPVRLMGVESPAGRISLPEGPILGCRFALQFSLYLNDMGTAAAAINKRLSKVATGPGFVCRGRNGDASGKLSEHAYGNALDITTIGMASGETVQVADALNPVSPSYALLREMRAKACGYFSTVLGPGSNAAHAEHFHLDMGRQGKSATYKICE